jgi:hypothetical protein
MVHVYYPESVLLREVIGRKIIDADRVGNIIYIVLDDGSKLLINLEEQVIELKVNK